MLHATPAAACNIQPPALCRAVVGAHGPTCIHLTCTLLPCPPPSSQVIEGCLGILDGEGAPGDSVHLLASHRSPSPPREPTSIAERLQRLSGQVRGCLLSDSMG